MKKDDVYIATIEYGKKKLKEGVTLASLQEHLKSTGFEYDYTFIKVLFLELFARKKMRLELQEWSNKSPEEQAKDCENDGLSKEAYSAKLLWAIDSALGL